MSQFKKKLKPNILSKVNLRGRGWWGWESPPPSHKDFTPLFNWVKFVIIPEIRELLIATHPKLIAIRLQRESTKYVG